MRSEAVQAIRELEPELRRLDVRAISLFWSVSEDRTRAESDVDILAEFEPPHTAKQYFDTLFLLEDKLGVHVDLAEPESLHRGLRDRVMAEALRVA